MTTEENNERFAHRLLTSSPKAFAYFQEEITLNTLQFSLKCFIMSQCPC